MQQSNPNRFSFLKQRRVRAGAVLLVLALGGLVWLGRGKPPAGATSFTARRGPLQINLLEGGSVEAKQAQEVRSEVKGYQGTKILSIVEEGYYVTEEDVKKGKLLVELDSSDLKQRITQQDIQYQSALASYIDAQQSLAIQINQNKSDIKMAEQKAKFALMDLEKYMGDVATREILARVALPHEIFTNETASAEQTLLESVENPTLAVNQVFGQANPNGDSRAVFSSSVSSTNLVTTNVSTNSCVEVTSTNAPVTPVSANLSAESDSRPTKPRLNSLTFDFTEYVDESRLGDGAAKQNLRKLKDDVFVAQTDLNVAKTKLEGTRRLYEKKFVTKTELDNDKVTVDKNELRLMTAETALELFKKYEFAKAAEEALSKYEEALQSLDRARKEAISRLAQSRARFRSAEGQFRIQENQHNEFQEQLSKCTIRAQKTGLVIYGGGSNQRFYNSEEQIREGATVRERQPIITIPDMSQMSVKVKIPEAHIKKIKKGMKARIQVDAFPDEQLLGEVTKVGVLPDSQDRWLNPDLKVYLTTISIEGMHDWIKPGMSAKVEILVKHFDNVVYVPVQAVVPNEGKHYCFVGKGPKPEKREVRIGEFNDEFIVIENGVREGEIVQLRSSEMPLEQEQETGEKPDQETKPAAPPAPTAQSEALKPKSLAAF